jgi:hypothetical protein
VSEIICDDDDDDDDDEYVASPANSIPDSYDAKKYLPVLRASISRVTFARLAWFSSKMGLGSAGTSMTLEDRPLVV